MSPLGAQWIEYGGQLGFRVVAPAQVRLKSGASIESDALLPDFGGRRGILIAAHFEPIGALADQLPLEGYGFSTLSEPRSSETIWDHETREEVVRMLRDWTWCGPAADEPAWMRDEQAEARRAAAPQKRRKE